MGPGTSRLWRCAASDGASSSDTRHGQARQHDRTGAEMSAQQGTSGLTGGRRGMRRKAVPATEVTGHRIYHSTPYPPDKTILFHNESSHFSSWPLRQFFFCVIPSREGGETPLLDCREVCKVLDNEIVEAFERKGLMYVRNFSEGIDVPWQDFFHTDDKTAVERTCSDSGMSCEWTELGLRVRQPGKGVRTHPRTGERVFFNQVQLHHVACLDEETRTAMRQLFADEDLPRNVYYGDGTPIPDEVMDRIGEVYEQLCVETPWQKSDLIALDNMLVAHAR